MTPNNVLLQALRAFLREDVQPALSGYGAYQNRIAANLLALLERELRHGDVLQTCDTQGLAALGWDHRKGLPALARGLRDGKQDDTELLRQYLRERTLLRLAIDNPNYSGLAQARERWPELAAELDERLQERRA